jgi:hypothetical protein
MRQAEAQRFWVGLEGGAFARAAVGEGESATHEAACVQVALLCAQPRLAGHICQLVTASRP